MKPEPLARQQVDHIDIGPLHQRGQSLAGRAADLGGLELGPAKHRVVDGRHPEPIVQTGQRRLVPGLPEPAQPDDSDTEPHVLRPDQARLLAMRSLLAVTLAFLRWYPAGYQLAATWATQKRHDEVITQDDLDRFEPFLMMPSPVLSRIGPLRARSGCFPVIPARLAFHVVRPVGSQ